MAIFPSVACSRLAARRKTRRPELLTYSSRARSTTSRCAPELITPKILSSNVFAFVASSFPDNANTTASAFLSSLMSMIYDSYGGKSIYLHDSTVAYGHQFSYCLERRQSYDKFSVAILLAAFETAAEPPEGSVIETEPALAKSSRINPLTAREPGGHPARRHLGS